MSEISTRVWLDERVWHEVTSRAVGEGMTVRELIPRLVRQSLAVAPALAPRGTASTGPVALTVEGASGASPRPQDLEPGLPVVILSDVYRCDVCGAEVRLGGLSNHLGKHKKERESVEAERS